MKEASGELSMTAITVIAITGLGVLFTTLVLPRLKATINQSTKCNATISCETPNAGAKTVRCTVCSTDDCSSTETVNCPVK